ncbi:MaoC family dehydratase [Actinomadura terrae]|uniref:MaoC family dehydratase n=1 Tax=Actinomadura terrae TaxID=604353 RepID=UPI001FA7C2A6|nr:MaoC family dehydratase [Actinomadura terrae]
MTITRALGEDFAAPTGDRYFEDYEPGATYEYGYVSVTESDILEFARRFDPQPIHIDTGYAETGPFQGIIASGWHTSSIMMRLFAVHFLSSVASLASPGVDELRWPAPVRPGDELRMRVTIIEARPSRSKPNRGLVRTRVELLNQDDRVVLDVHPMNLVGRRPTVNGA